MQLAAVEPAPVVPPPEPEITPAAELASFLAGFDGGDCFAAQVEGTEDAPTLAAFATDFADSVALQFALTQNFEEPVSVAGYRAEAAQCGALAFVTHLQRTAATITAIALDAERIEDGGTVAGTIAAPAGAALHLFIVDDEGKVTDATEYLISADRFAAPVRLTGEDAAGKLQLVLALAAPHTLDLPASGQPASTYFPALAKSLGPLGGQQAIAIAAFAIE